MTARRRPPVHLVEVGLPLAIGGGLGEHRAAPDCPCAPTLYRDLGDWTVIAYVHHYQRPPEWRPVIPPSPARRTPDVPARP